MNAAKLLVSVVAERFTDVETGKRSVGPLRRGEEVLVLTDIEGEDTAIGQIRGTRRTYCFYFSRMHIIDIRLSF
jgi:hypothetical protein